MELIIINKEIFKIVLTGGPAAGKTSLCARVIKEFEEKGYRVIIIPETATDLISGFGLKPFGNCLSNLTFQDIVLTYQFEKEKIALYAAQFVPENKIIMIFDRGVLDGKAYICTEEFNQLLLNHNTNEIEKRDNYDCVIHLVTSAKGAAHAYNLDNAARTETIEQACLLDDKTLNSWIGHPHLRIIDNSTNFEDKINRAIQEIYSTIGEPIPMEIERKYLIEYPNIEKLKEVYNITEVDIIQTYLKSENGIERRVRQRGKDGNFVFFYTEKKKITELERAETERKISKDEYFSLLNQADTSLNQIRKKRLCFVFENQYFELDLYDFDTNKAILEIELTDKNQIVSLPTDLKIIEECTFDSNLKNRIIAETLILK